MNQNRPSILDCTLELTMVVDPGAMDDDQIAIIRKRLLAAGIRLKLVTRSGSPPGEEFRI